MTLSLQLREQYAILWDRMVTHEFVEAFAQDNLSQEQIRCYFLQDYVFLRDFVTLLSLGIAKAPDFDVARRLSTFLAEILQGEEALFRKSFRDWGLRPDQYSPPDASEAAMAFGNLMTSVAYQGTFADILTVLLVTEWTYLDWATRLVREKRVPRNQPSRDWVALHSSEDFRLFVEWIRERFDLLSLGHEARSQVERLFQATLQYELQFWETSWSGNARPDEGCSHLTE